MEIQKHTGEKLEDYFSRLVAEGFEFDASYQNITLADIESVLRRLNQFSNDKRDVITHQHGRDEVIRVAKEIGNDTGSDA